MAAKVRGTVNMKRSHLWGKALLCQLGQCGLHCARLTWRAGLKQHLAIRPLLLPVLTGHNTHMSHTDAHQILNTVAEPAIVRSA